MLSLSQFLIPEILRWGHMRKNKINSFNLLVSSLYLGTWSFILAICWHSAYNVRVSHKMLKHHKKKRKTSWNIFQKSEKLGCYNPSKL